MAGQKFWWTECGTWLAWYLKWMDVIMRLAPSDEDNRHRMFGHVETREVSAKVRVGGI